MSDRPPLNPKHLKHLGPIGIEVLDQNGTHKFDPNGIIIAFLRDGLLEKLKPIDNLGSICSGAPAVMYRTAEAEFALSPDELHRLQMRALTPEEFKAIRDRVGEVWEIHDDFYDPETGEAFQPKIPVPGQGGTSPQH